MSSVKLTIPLLALLAVLAIGFSACTTDANRRDLYSPAKAHGPYTRALQDGTWDQGVQPEQPAPVVKAVPKSS